MGQRSAIAFVVLLCVARQAWSVPSDTNVVDEFDVGEGGYPHVHFVGRSPQFKLFPTPGTRDFLMVRFGQIAELDADGAPVSRHTIQSLAAVRAAAWMQGVRLSPTGGYYKFVTMDLPLSDLGASWDSTCTAKAQGGDNPTGGSRTAPPATNLGGAAIRMTAYFGSDSPASGDRPSSVQYGDTNITLAQGDLMFSIEYKSWPFCDDVNGRLQINLEIKGTMDYTAGSNTSTALTGSMPSLTIPLGNSTDITSARLQLNNYAFERQTSMQRLPVGLATMRTGGKLVLQITLPAKDSVYYDPQLSVDILTTIGAGCPPHAHVRMVSMVAAAVVLLLLLL